MKVQGINLTSVAVLGVLAAGVVVALYIAKKGIAGAAAGAVGAVADAAAGTVVGIGEIVGVPATSETECEKAKREGRTWDASFACPAGEFLSYLVKPMASAADQDSDAETLRLLRRYPSTGAYGQ